MKKAPTLIDYLYRTSFSNSKPHAVPWRGAITDARRFVLDKEMSVFLADLSTQAFSKPNMSDKVRTRMAETLRTGARLPHKTTWIEYNLRANQQRVHEILGKRDVQPYEVPNTEGWLLQQHPKIDTAFIAHLAARTTDTSEDVYLFPIAIAWTVDEDTVLPWRRLPFSENSNAQSEIATGLLGYKTDRVGYVYSDLVETPNKPEAISGLIREWAGVLRRMWALLATINDLPVNVTEVRASKGFFAKSQYRRFLDHKTVTINVPERLYRKTIRDALALAHRRAHSVRGHWRRDWRHPLSPLCDHDWTADEKHQSCKLCHGVKSWIAEHERGDASRGFVTHDYIVKHEDGERQ